ncbi:MAG: hypothetical protein IPP74_02670 [Alphaproteobacteria bacterium]|nr:hypothetical protein [Alphaproteobacteria bacterium]
MTTLSKLYTISTLCAFTVFISTNESYASLVQSEAEDIQLASSMNASIPLDGFKNIIDMVQDIRKRTSKQEAPPGSALHIHYLPRL